MRGDNPSDRSIDTTLPPPSPLRCAVMNAITSADVTRAGVLSTKQKNTFKSNATARIVFGLARARKNSR